jgi:hypothetical protein
MSSIDILAFAAPIMFSFAVAMTSWLSYRRIMKKYPAKPVAPKSQEVIAKAP